MELGPDLWGRALNGNVGMKGRIGAEDWKGAGESDVGVVKEGQKGSGETLGHWGETIGAGLDLVCDCCYN